MKKGLLSPVIEYIKKINDGVKVMDEHQLKITYEGQTHQIDVNMLLVTLLNLSEIITEIASKTMPEQQVNIKIRAPKPGSFIIELQLVCEQALNVFAALFPNIPTGVVSLAAIVSIVNDMLGIKKHLGGAKPDDVVESKNGFVTIEKNTRKLEVSKEAYTFYSENIKVNGNINKIFTELGENPEIEGFTMEDENGSTFHANQAEFFRMAQKNILLDKKEQTLLISKVRIIAIKVVFDKKRKWEFIYEGNKISAFITDVDFWSRVDEGLSFRKGDSFEVDLTIIQELDEETGAFMNQNYEVVLVHKLIPRMEEEKLF